MKAILEQNLSSMPFSSSHAQGSGNQEEQPSIEGHGLIARIRKLQVVDGLAKRQELATTNRTEEGLNTRIMQPGFQVQPVHHKSFAMENDATVTVRLRQSTRLLDLLQCLRPSSP